MSTLAVPTTSEVAHQVAQHGLSSDPRGHVAAPHGFHHRALLAIGALSVVGTAAELTVLGHYSSVTQLIPYAALLAMAASLVRTRRALTDRVRRFIHAIGALTFCVSLLGAWFHFHANLELAREIDPSSHGLRYLWSGVTGKIPFLAPLVLGQLALILLATSMPSGADRSGR